MVNITIRADDLDRWIVIAEENERLEKMYKIAKRQLKFIRKLRREDKMDDGAFKIFSEQLSDLIQDTKDKLAVQLRVEHMQADIALNGL